MRTEELSDETTYAQLGAWWGIALPPMRQILNAGGTSDSDKPEMTF